MAPMIGYEVPYNFKPHKHQEEVLDCSARFKVIIWHRRARKTSLAIVELLRRAVAQTGIYLYCSPFFSQTKKICWDDPQMISRYLPPNGFTLNHTNLTIKTPNGSLIYFTGADNPDALRGINARGIVLDEMDDIKIDLWQSVLRPIVAQNGGWCIFMGTPKGINNLHILWNQAEGRKDWARFKLKASESGLIAPEELDAARRELPEAIYNQEFECEFVSGGSSVFRNVERLMVRDPWHIEEERQYKLGVDLAKLNDWTAITPIDLHTWRLGPVDRFNQVDYPMIEARIEAAHHKYNKAPVTIDATGIGEAVCDHLERRGIPIERVVFTEDSRMNVLENFAILCERMDITMTYDEVVKAEMEAMRYELGGVSKRKLKIASPIHDDTVFSHALAVHDLGFKLTLPRNMPSYPKALPRRARYSPF